MHKVMKEDPRERIFGSKPQYLETYIKFQQLITVDYQYEILYDLDAALDRIQLFTYLEKTLN